MVNCINLVSSDCTPVVVASVLFSRRESQEAGVVLLSFARAVHLACRSGVWRDWLLLGLIQVGQYLRLTEVITIDSYLIIRHVEYA